MDRRLTHPLHRAMRVSCAFALVLIVAACGVRMQTSPTALDVAGVPDRLNDPTTTVAPPTSAPTTTTSPTTQLVTTWFVSSGRLSPVQRAQLRQPTSGERVGAVVAGVIPDEQVRGLRSALPSTTSVTNVRVVAGVATVDLAAPFPDLPSAEQVLAVAQLVYSLTEDPTITGMRLTIAGSPVSAPRPDGTLAGDVLTRADYAALAPTP